MLYLRENTRKSEDSSVAGPMMLLGTRAKLGNVHGPYMERPTHRERRVADAIRAHLHSSTLHKDHKHHGYTATETAYHLLGGKEAGYKPVQVHHEGESHWYLRHDGEQGRRHLDITHDHFQTPVDHHAGRGKGFLTRHPSKRSKELMQDVERHLGQV